MERRKFLIGVYALLAMLAVFSASALNASSQVHSLLEQEAGSRALADGVIEHVVFSEAVVENMVLEYNITEFETASSQPTGPAAIGYDEDHQFWGENLTVSEGDTFWIKVDTRDDQWEIDTDVDYLLYSLWDYGVLGWSLDCNTSLVHGATYYEVDPVFSRLMVFPIAQRIIYSPNDGMDYTNTMVDVFGPYNDNGTVDPGDWSGSTHTANFDWNCTYYMLNDPPYLHTAYNKIPATFTTDMTTGHLLAHWNYSYYDMEYADGGNRRVSWAYANGWWPFRPFVQVVTDVETGITQSLEFYFGSDSAWRQTTLWDGSDHPFYTQVKTLKLELESIDYTIDYWSPKVTSPANINYEEGTTGHSISWTPTDINPGNYTVFQNGATSEEGDWTSGTAITLSIDGLAVGTYNYTIMVRDAMLNSASDTVMVTVTAIPPTTTPSSTPTSSELTTPAPGFELPSLLIGLVVLSLGTLLYKRRKKTRKRE